MKRWTLAVAATCVSMGSLVLAQPAPDRQRSSYHDMGRALQQMQDDEFANPGMLYVRNGEQLWARAVGAANKACADCHAAGSMVGVAARHPAIPPGRDRPADLEGRINQCRTERQQAERLAPESEPLLALAAYVARQSRGLPIAPPADPRLVPFQRDGKALFETRQGQLNLSCANCHDDNAGKKLAAATIPQGHPDGYPIYRLEWQALGSLKRRLRNCLVGMRAEPYDHDSTEYVSLQLHLMDRARGMTFDAPGVRP